MRIPAEDAIKKALSGRPVSRFPAVSDPRNRQDWLFPVIQPGFAFEPGDRIFTIGSCFARNVESFLTGFDVPTSEFAVPESEWAGLPNGLLNEYDPATMSQRITWALEGRDTRQIRGTLIGKDDAIRDMLLAVGTPVLLDRALERRAEIDAVYAKLPKSDAVFITLGLIEGWYDNESGCYLNRMPERRLVQDNPGRFDFVRLELPDVLGLLRPALDGLISAGVSKIVMTVSPVPLMTTFSGQDCAVATQYSKAVLRVAAEMLSAEFAGNVDYFPSFEIVMSGGLKSFGDDNRHVYNHVVKWVVTHMLEAYVPATPDNA